MSENVSTWRTTVATLLCVMTALSVAALAVPVLAVAAGVLSFIAAALLLPRVSRAQQRVVAVLTVAGLSALAWGAHAGADPDWRRMVTLNQGLISMLTAVSFLQLVAGDAEPARPPVAGRRAVLRTMAMVHGLGSIINISALTLVAERLKQGSALTWPDALLLSRSYSTAAFWSPFWGATAVALTYAPDARLSRVIPLGMVLAAVALLLSLRSVVREMGSAVEGYDGFPASMRVLSVPIALVAACLVTNVALPGLPATGVIALCALMVTGTLLLARVRLRAGAAVVQHAHVRLPAMGGELTLFCSAGVLAIGISTVVRAAPPPLPLEEFTAWSAWALLLLIVGISMVGVHPAISIAAAAALLQPLAPEPTLFALTAVVAWGSVAAAAPLSGLNIVMNGQFGIDNFRLARRNGRYLAAMVGLALPLLHLCAALE